MDASKKALETTIKEVASQTTIKGFRKGKAPLHLVQKEIDKQKLYNDVLRKLLPKTYTMAVKQHNLQPIISPKVTPISTKEGEDWKFKAVSCERPDIKLNDYQKQVKGALAKEKKDKKPSYDEKMQKVTNALLENIKVEVADILLEDEMNRMLTRLLDQVNNLGMTIEQYLSSKATTIEKLRTNFRNQANKTLQLEFILQAIVVDRKIKIEKEEIDKMIKAAPDKKIQEKLNTPTEKAYIASILAKRKVLDFLTTL